MNAEALDFGIDQGTHPGMPGQFGVRREFDSMVGGFGGNGDGIGNDEGNDEFAPVAHNQSVQNVRAGLQSVFDRLRSHKFSGGRLD